MKSFWTVLVAILFLASMVFGFSISANAHLGMFVEKFSWKPYSKWIINGVEHSAKTTKLPGNMYWIEWQKDGETAFYMAEKYNSGSGKRIVSQWTMQEINIWEYSYKSGKLDSVLIKAFWPELTFVPMTPYLKPSPSKQEGQERYLIDHIEMLVTATHDEKETVTGGTFEITYYLRDGQQITKEQQMTVEYPDENTMRVTFEGFGEPWAYVDKWQEYRLEDGKLVWEICRSIAKGGCDGSK